MNKYFISFFYGNEHPESTIFETSLDLDDADDLDTFLKYPYIYPQEVMAAAGIHGYDSFVLFNWKRLK